MKGTMTDTIDSGGTLEIGDGRMTDTADRGQEQMTQGERERGVESAKEYPVVWNRPKIVTVTISYLTRQ